MDKRLREDQILFLQKIKPFLTRQQFVPDILRPVEQPILPVKGDEKITDLLRRIERLERSLTHEDRPEDGFRTAKMKEKVVSLLQQNKRLTASQMAEMLHLSRTRCSEYFRELMIEGKVEGVLVDRQKYYKLVR